jgi:hypothetical protein
MLNQLKPPPANAISPGDLYNKCLAREKNVLELELTRADLYKLLFIARPGLPRLDYGDWLALRGRRSTSCD